MLGNFSVLGVGGDAHPEDFWAGYLVEWKAAGFFMSFILCDAAFFFFFLVAAHI